MIPALEVRRCYEGDARELLSRIAGESVDLILTDPPYGLDFQSNMPIRGWKKPLIANDGEEASLALLDAVLPELVRVLRHGGVLCMFAAGGSDRPCLPEAWLRVSKALTMENVLCWDKMAPGLGWRYRYSWESILVAYKGDFRNTWNGGEKSINILRYPRIIPGPDEHPTPKPTSLLRRLIIDNTNKGNLVLDPFAGSGTTLKAAAELERAWIGIELDPKWCAQANMLASCEEAQLKML